MYKQKERKMSELPLSPTRIKPEFIYIYTRVSSFFQRFVKGRDREKENKSNISFKS